MEDAKSLLQEFSRTTKVAISGEYNRGDIVLDIIKDATKYAKATGMSERGVNTFVTIFARVLLSVSDNGSSLENVTDVLKGCLLSSCTTISPLVSNHTVTYISITILKHFKLYHYLLHQEQQESHTHLQMVIDTAEKKLSPLAEGMDESEWKKREKVRELQEQHELKQTAMKEERLRSLDKAKRDMEELEIDVLNFLETKSLSGLLESEIIELTRKVVEAKTEQFLETLCYEMSQQEESIGMTMDSLTAQTGAIRQPASPSPGKKGKLKTPNSKSPASGRTSGRNT